MQISDLAEFLGSFDAPKAGPIIAQLRDVLE